LFTVLKCVGLLLQILTLADGINYEKLTIKSNVELLKQVEE